jgi:hypothetical protein
MPGALSAAMNRRLEDLIVAWTRRRWPALRLVPARWISLAVAPTARRLRRVLSLAVLTAVLAIALIVNLLSL